MSPVQNGLIRKTKSERPRDDPSARKRGFRRPAWTIEVHCWLAAGEPKGEAMRCD